MPKRRILVLLAAVLTAADCSSTSDEDRIRELLAAVESAAEERDTGAVMDRVDADYTDARGMDKAQLQQYLRGYFLLHPTIEVITRVREVKVETATRARVLLDLAMVGQKVSSDDSAWTGDTETLQIELRRRDGEWLVARADRLEK
jgi:hypothetical protein